MLIAVCGLKGSGKDTVGDYLVNTHGFIRLHFADTLKDIMSIMFGWRRDLLEGSTPESREFREQKDEWWSNKLEREVTPRIMLQQMGTELFRNHFHKDIWRLIIEKKINDHKGKHIVITDCRFQNEVEMVRLYGCKLIFVYRDLPDWFLPYKQYIGSVPEHIHTSEYDWIRNDFDCEINNNGTYDILYNKIEDFLRIKHKI